MLLVRKGQKEVKLKPNEGGVLFSFKSSGPTAFAVQNVRVQEINQYKIYQNSAILAPLSGQTSSIALFSLKLPQGTYRIVDFPGWLGGIFGSQYLLPCNRVFDISLGEIKYIGRIGAVVYDTYSDIVVAEGFYEEDIASFLEKFPALKGLEIKKEIIY
jgi:hypothetical protein